MFLAVPRWVPFNVGGLVCLIFLESLGDGGSTFRVTLLDLKKKRCPCHKRATACELPLALSCIAVWERSILIHAVAYPCSEQGVLYPLPRRTPRSSSMPSVLTKWLLVYI